MTDSSVESLRRPWGWLLGILLVLSVAALGAVARSSTGHNGLVVLAPLSTPSPTPQPSPTASPTPTPTSSPISTPTTTSSSPTPTPAVAPAIPADCSVDVTQKLLAWIASVPDNSVLTFAAGGCYRVDGTLELTDRNGLTFEGNAATFRAMTTGAADRAHWRLLGGSRFLFRNMTIQGANPKGGTFNSTLQRQHAVDLRGAAGVEIDRVTATDVYGECVYVGQDWRSKSWSKSVRVHDSGCARTGRMGIAITAGRDVRVETSSFSRIGLSSFVIEPNGAGFGAQNVTFTNNLVDSVYDYIFVATGDGPVDNVTVSYNTIHGKGHMGAFAPVGQRRSAITITGNTADTGYYDANGSAMEFVRIDGLTVTQNIIPLSGPNMALATVFESCKVGVSGNSYETGVIEVRLNPWTCP